MLVLFWTATPSFLHTMYGAGAPFTGHHRLEVLFKNTYCVFGAWSNVGLTILDFKEKRKVIVRLLWCMHIKKYSNSDTIQCSGQSNIRILFVFLPFLCLRLSGCGLKDTVDLRVPTFYFFMFSFFFHVKLSIIDFIIISKNIFVRYWNAGENLCYPSAFKTSMWMEKDKKEKGP